MVPPMKNFRSVFDPGPAQVKTFIPKHLTCTTGYYSSRNRFSWQGILEKNLRHGEYPYNYIPYISGALVARVRSQKTNSAFMRKCRPVGLNRTCVLQLHCIYFEIDTTLLYILSASYVIVSEYKHTCRARCDFSLWLNCKSLMITVA